MTSMAEEMARDRRRGILEHLALAEGHSLAAGVLTVLLDQSRKNIYRDMIEADITLLAQHGMVTVEDLPSAAGPQKWITATGLGLDVARGRRHPSVSDKLPGY